MLNLKPPRHTPTLRIAVVHFVVFAWVDPDQSADAGICDDDCVRSGVTSQEILIGPGNAASAIWVNGGQRGTPSRPGEFHPEPLTDPDVRLSPHPARATQRRLAPSGETAGFLRSPVDPTNTVSDPPPSLHGHYPASSLLWGGPRLTGPSVLSASRVHRLSTAVWIRAYSAAGAFWTERSGLSR